MDNTPEVKEAQSKGSLRFGTVDSWLLYVGLGLYFLTSFFFFFICALFQMLYPHVRYFSFLGLICDIETHGWGKKWIAYHGCNKRKQDYVDESENIRLGYFFMPVMTNYFT